MFGNHSQQGSGMFFSISNGAYVTSYCFEINPLLMLLALLNKITKFSYFLIFC